MTVPKVKSRPQLRSQAKQRRTSKKHNVDKPKAKQTNSDAQSPTKAPKGRHRCFKRAPVTTDSSEAARSATDEQDHETSGTYESDNRNESGDDGISAIPCGSGAPTEFEDEDDDPPASLLNLAPIWYPQPDWSWPDTLPAATETTLGDSPVAEHATAGPFQVAGYDGRSIIRINSNYSTSSISGNNHYGRPIFSVDSCSSDSDSGCGRYCNRLYSSGSHHYINFGSGIIVWHKWVVDLFAGRKPVSPMHNDVNNVPPPVSIISWIREDRDSDAALPLPSQPHLELRYLIPATFDKRMRLNYHSNIHPAPQHDSVGKVATHEDASPTNNVQRGFVVANRPASAPSPPRRDIDHYSSLLARDDTNWAEWNKLNITADAMPFTRSQSDTQFLHPQTGMKMARANGHLTKSQTGHAFLEDAGHRYPFGQGPGW
ncbi:hypothetical protein J4E85_005312 [Alternaria conjuncta]|uniref:uncharacterized protein n=1 Tax=Alternaria conjuncta TaxID=181017 RepID=UPI00221E4B81|nr:uncharacterized protein J4E85_005312 [Alternaria conjuncta]KAI4928694.1 hypothetical protein J4E85_005312 [Alternaria conjuncta]